MLQESCAVSYISEMSTSTMKENLTLQILSLVQLNQLTFHSIIFNVCKTLNSLRMRLKSASHSFL